MKAMILAAGFGTRLKPLTDTLPKALITYKNKTLLQIQIEKLINSGVDSVIINAHHFADKIEKYIKENNFGLKEINVIKEKEILGTGGGILNAKDFLLNEKYFLVVNVDVYTDFDFQKIISSHENNPAFATVAIQKRNTARYLEFDDELKLIGRENSKSNKNNLFAFNGIHIISNKIFEKNLPVKYSDIVDAYLQMIKEGEIIRGYDVEKSNFKDLGKIENLRN